MSPTFIMCALLVRLTSRGPVLFRQKRVGYLGHPFTVFKFRTMVHGAETLGSSVVVGGDARLTRVGAFLRRTKLDELPQLLNVLRGDMSIVGPRPRVQSDINLDDPMERVLLTARPGLTSYASIYHHREAEYCARHINPQEAYRTKVLPQKSLLDCEYVQNLTFRLDFKLIVVTFLLVFAPGRTLPKKVRILGRDVWGYSRVAQMMLDLAVYMTAAWLAYNFWFETGLPAFYRRQMWMFLFLVPAVRMLVHRLLGVYDMMWRYINVEDSLRLAVAFAPVSLVLLTLRLGLPRRGVMVLFLVPLGVITLEYLITLTAGLGLRGLRRMLYMWHHHYQPLPEAARRILILGAGLTGMSAAMDMRRYPHLQLVGFVDDDPTKFRRLIVGSRVLGNSHELETLCPRHKVTDVVICAKSLPQQKAAALRERCNDMGVKLHALPSLDWVLRGEAISAAA
jgi:lipopolysaccharide/colanic/teichoic acid biosynthesis glycosyltransferase